MGPLQTVTLYQTVRRCKGFLYLLLITYPTARPHFSEDSKLENFRAPSPPPPPKISSIEDPPPQNSSWLLEEPLSTTAKTKRMVSWSQTFAVFWVSFWVIPRRLNFICRRFGTPCPIFIGGVNRENNWGRSFYIPYQPRPGYSSYLLHLWRWKCVPKRRHMKFRRRDSPKRKHATNM